MQDEENKNEEAAETNETNGKKPLPGAKPASDTKSAPKQDLKKEGAPPSKMQQFTRKAIRSLIYAGVLFLAGMLTWYFAFQRPQTAGLEGQIETLTTERADLAAQVETLEARVDELGPFEAENESLAAELAAAELHVKLLSALNDVQSARLALALENPGGAKLALSRTADTLEDLKALLPADTQSEADGMASRLSLALGGIDSDAFAAASDLEVLANSLIQLENTLFVGP